MSTRPTKTTSIQIAPGGMTCIHDGRGVLLHVQYGAAWITQSGSADDIWLEAGESFRIDRDGLTIVSAECRAPLALMRIGPPAATARPLAERVVARLASACSGLRTVARHATPAG